MSEHANIAIDTGIDIYFADPTVPGSAHQRDTNGLLRQYWPKSSDLRNLTHAIPTKSPTG